MEEASFGPSPQEDTPPGTSAGGGEVIMKIAILSGLIAAGLVPWLAGMQEQNLAPPTCANVHVHEPVVIFEVSGTTLSGSIDQTLIAYGDGALKLASAVP